MILEEIKNKNWTDYVKDHEEHMSHWLGRLFVGQTLFRDYNEYEVAYDILREIYLDNEIRYDRHLFGSYEDYIVEKANFYKDMAELSHIITKEAAQSIPYIDEALIMLDGFESVGPYISIKEIEKLREYYLATSLDEAK